MTTKNYKVNMHCPSCAIVLEGLEEDVPGVEEIVADYKKGTLRATFNEEQLSEQELIEAIAKEGYQAEAL